MGDRIIVIRKERTRVIDNRNRNDNGGALPPPDDGNMIFAGCGVLFVLIVIIFLCGGCVAVMR